MSELFLVVVSGIASGAVYGLLGLGLVIIYRATDVVNFALASMATLAVYVALMVVQRGRRGGGRRDRRGPRGRRSRGSSSASW